MSVTTRVREPISTPDGNAHVLMRSKTPELFRKIFEKLIENQFSKYNTQFKIINEEF